MFALYKLKNIADNHWMTLLSNATEILPQGITIQIIPFNATIYSLQRAMGKEPSIDSEHLTNDERNKPTTIIGSGYNLAQHELRASLQKFSNQKDQSEKSKFEFMREEIIYHTRDLQSPSKVLYNYKTKTLNILTTKARALRNSARGVIGLFNHHADKIKKAEAIEKTIKEIHTAKTPEELLMQIEALNKSGTLSQKTGFGRLGSQKGGVVEKMQNLQQELSEIVANMQELVSQPRSTFEVDSGSASTPSLK